MTPLEYKQFEETFKIIFEDQQLKLPVQAVKEITHYLSHGELEMAFEGFCLKVIENNLLLNKEQQKSILYLGEELHLDNEAVFD